MTTNNTRTEHDTMGNIEVPANAYWGAQTQRSRENFKIGGQTLPTASFTPWRWSKSRRTHQRQTKPPR